MSSPNGVSGRQRFFSYMQIKYKIFLGIRLQRWANRHKSRTPRQRLEKWASVGFFRDTSLKIGTVPENLELMVTFRRLLTGSQENSASYTQRDGKICPLSPLLLSIHGGVKHFGLWTSGHQHCSVATHRMYRGIVNDHFISNYTVSQKRKTPNSWP